VTIQGRDLDPTKLIAMIGSTKLTAMAGSTTTQVLFKVDSSPQAGALAVYNPGGEVWKLDPNYRVFDPNVGITRVVPTSFQQGDTVTVCGRSLFQAMLGFDFTLQTTFPTNLTGPITLQNGSFIQIGDKYLRAVDAAVSDDGTRMTFIAGDLFQQKAVCIPNCSSSTQIQYFLVPVLPAPASQSGALTFRALDTVGMTTGPTVTWQLGGPHISKVHGQDFNGPFVMLQSENSPLDEGMVWVEGTNLAGQWRIGSTAINSFDFHGDGTLLVLYLPPTASSGQICGTATNGVTACTSNVFVAFPGPTIADMPESPLSVGTTYTINGIHLQPPPEATGLTYKFSMTDLGNDPITAACNHVLNVLDHTQYHIVFRIGDPGAPVATGCSPLGSLGDPNANNVMLLMGTYNGLTYGMMFPQRFYLAQ
jgi:hypothetical protein